MTIVGLHQIMIDYHDDSVIINQLLVHIYRESKKF